MNVLFIQDIGDVGGATKSLLELISNLHNKYNVNPIVVTSDYNSVNKFCEKNGFKNYSINHKQVIVPPSHNKIKNFFKKALFLLLLIRNQLYNFVALKKLEKEIDFSKVDLIHTNVNRDIIGFMISKKYHIKHVVHLREFGDLDYNCFCIKPGYVRYMNKYCNCFIAISDVIKKHWIRKGIDEEKICVIYNGVNVNQQLNIKTQKNKKKKIYCVFSGNISKNKGQEQVIRAFGLLDKLSLSKLSLDIYGSGDGEYIDYLQKLVNSLGLSEIIEFKEYDKNLSSKLKGYDIGFICSKAEAFGRVTIEFMLSNVLVIASNCGANVELIENNKTGLLYTYGDIIDLKNKIVFAINNKNEVNKIIQKAKEESEKKFTTKINSNNIYELYEEVIYNYETNEIK